MANENEGAGANGQQEDVSLSDQLLADAEKGGMKLDKTPPAKKEEGAGGDNGGTGGSGAAGGDNGAGDDDIDDAKLLKYLEKKGVKVASVDELKPKAAEPTAEEKAKADEEKRTKAISFGLTNKLFTQAEYDQSLKFDAREPLSVVKEDYTARVKKLNPEISDEDAEEMFNEQFFQLEDEGGTKFKLGQQMLVDEYNKIKNDRFGKINEVFKHYEGYENTQARAKVYQTEINTFFTGLPKEFEVPINGENFKIPIDATQLEAIKQDYLTTDMMNVALDQHGKINTESLKEEVLKDWFYKNRDTIISKAAVSYSDKQLTIDRQGRKNYLRPEHTSDEGTQKAEGNSLSDQMLSGKA